MEQNKDQGGAAVRGEAVALTDGRCDEIAGEVITRIAASKGMHPSELSTDVKGHATLGRELIRAGFSARAADAPSEPSEPWFHVIVDEDGGPVFVTKLRQSAQEHINDACDVDVESAGKWKSIPVFEKQLGNQSKPSAWIDQFGNVFPLGAYQPSGKPSYLDADKRGWKPLFRAADALDSQPTEADARDAARYRLLRDGGNHDYRLCKWAHSGVQVMKRLDGEELDRALDQAAADHKASWMTKATERASSQPTDGGVRNG